MKRKLKRTGINNTKFPDIIYLRFGAKIISGDSREKHEQDIKFIKKQSGYSQQKARDCKKTYFLFYKYTLEEI